MRRRDLLRNGLIAGAALLLGVRPARADERQIVLLQPLAPVPSKGAIERARQAIEAVYGFEVRVAKPLPMPKQAWFAPRKRWRAERIIAVLAEEKPPEAFRILGLTAADISTTKPPHDDWGVLGLGDIAGAAAVLSTFRTTKNVSKKLAEQRFAKVAVHELGHTLGLEHCPITSCLMEDAQAKIATVDRETHLCERCRMLLARRGFVLPPPPDEGLWAR